MVGAFRDKACFRRFFLKETLLIDQAKLYKESVGFSEGFGVSLVAMKDAMARAVVAGQFAGLSTFFIARSNATTESLGKVVPRRNQPNSPPHYGISGDPNDSTRYCVATRQFPPPSRQSSNWRNSL